MHEVHDFPCSHSELLYTCEMPLDNGFPAVESQREAPADDRQEITEGDYRRHLAGRSSPPIYQFAWNGREWDFAIPDSYGFLIAFGHSGGKYWAQKTPLLNPDDVNVSVEWQIKQPHLIQDAIFTRLKAIAEAWLPTWRRMSKSLAVTADASVKQAPIPTICLNDAQLRSELFRAQHKVGDLVVRDDLCFVRVNDESPTWHLLRQDRLLAYGSFAVSATDTGELETMLRKARATVSPARLR